MSLKMGNISLFRKITTNDLKWYSCCENAIWRALQISCEGWNLVESIILFESKVSMEIAEINSVSKWNEGT